MQIRHMYTEYMYYNKTCTCTLHSRVCQGNELHLHNTYFELSLSLVHTRHVPCRLKHYLQVIGALLYFNALFRPDDGIRGGSSGGGTGSPLAH